MKIDHTPCRTERIDDFLSGAMNAAEVERFEAHLETCDSCGKTLESAVAAPEFWAEAKELLASESEEQHSVATSEELLQSLRRMTDPTDDPDMIGRFAGYEVSGVVGVGGMGLVIKARDISLDRFVAIKVLHPNYASHSAARKRFAREAQAAAAVHHDNVIAIYGVDTWNEMPFLVMPYIKGESLQQRIDRKAPLGIEEAIGIAIQIARGLTAAHDQGLIHRDIKPANILMPAGVARVIITDFGLARASDDVSLTNSNMLAGTPQYMSPEQTRGKPLDMRSDLFSLGAVLYAMLSGRPPFRAETAYGVLGKIADEPHRKLTEIQESTPRWLSAVADRLLEKSPEHRFKSAEEVADYLEDCLAHLRQPATITLPRLAPAKRRLNMWPYALLFLVATLLCFVAYILFPPRPPAVAEHHESTGEAIPSWDYDDSSLTGLETEIIDIRHSLHEFFPNTLSELEP